MPVSAARIGGSRLSARSKFAVAAAAAALALVPAAAHAQGAGDDQYQDPFGDEAAPTATPRPAQPRATATPPPPAAPPAATATAVPPSATPAPGPELPYTGMDTWPLALGGALLLGAGLKLRAHLREPD